MKLQARATTVDGSFRVSSDRVSKGKNKSNNNNNSNDKNDTSDRNRILRLLRIAVLIETI